MDLHFLFNFLNACGRFHLLIDTIDRYPKQRKLRLEFKTQKAWSDIVIAWRRFHFDAWLNVGYDNGFNSSISYYFPYRQGFKHNGKVYIDEGYSFKHIYLPSAFRALQHKLFIKRLRHNKVY